MKKYVATYIIIKNTFMHIELENSEGDDEEAEEAAKLLGKHMGLYFLCINEKEEEL